MKIRRETWKGTIRCHFMTIECATGKHLLCDHIRSNGLIEAECECKCHLEK